MFPTFLTLAQATQASLSTWHPTTLWEYLLTVVMWGVVGIVTLLIGFKLFDWSTPKIKFATIGESHTAIAILVAGFLLAVGLILHAAISIQ